MKNVFSIPVHVRTRTLSCIFYCDAAGQQSQPLLVVRNAERIIGYWHVRLVLPPGRVSPEGAPASVQRKLPIPEHPASPNATDIDLTRMAQRPPSLCNSYTKMQKDPPPIMSFHAGLIISAQRLQPHSPASPSL